jgi:hypothetical protein
MLNPLRKKRVIVEAMPNSLLREINSLRSRCHALRLGNIEYHDMVVALCILLLYLSMISGGYRNPTHYSYYFNSIFLSRFIHNIFLGNSL